MRIFTLLFKYYGYTICKQCTFYTLYGLIINVSVNNCIQNYKLYIKLMNFLAIPSKPFALVLATFPLCSGTTLIEIAVCVIFVYL